MKQRASINSILASAPSRSMKTKVARLLPHLSTKRLTSLTVISNLTCQNDLRFLSQQLQPNSVGKTASNSADPFARSQCLYAARQLRIGDCAAEKLGFTGSPHGVRAATISKIEWRKCQPLDFDKTLTQQGKPWSLLACPARGRKQS